MDRSRYTGATSSNGPLLLFFNDLCPLSSDSFTSLCHVERTSDRYRYQQRFQAVPHFGSRICRGHSWSTARLQTSDLQRTWVSLFASFLFSFCSFETYEETPFTGIIENRQCYQFRFRECQLKTEEAAIDIKCILLLLPIVSNLIIEIINRSRPVAQVAACAMYPRYMSCWR